MGRVGLPDSRCVFPPLILHICTYFKNPEFIAARRLAYHLDGGTMDLCKLRASQKDRKPAGAQLT